MSYSSLIYVAQQTNFLLKKRKKKFKSSTTRRKKNNRKRGLFLSPFSLIIIFLTPCCRPSCHFQIFLFPPEIDTVSIIFLTGVTKSTKKPG